MSKIKAHKLILGTVQMGLDYGVNNSKGQIALKESFLILKCAYDNGIGILDSAEAYGNAHQIIGEFHSKFPNKMFEVITKLPHHFDANISVRVSKYLEDLRIDRLHALLFHSYDSYTNNLNQFDVLLDLKASNKIKFIGVSVYTNKEIEKVILNEDVDIIQVPFNLLDNSALRQKVLEKAKLKGKTIHTRSAFLQGLFFKAVNSKNNTVIQLRKELEQLLDITTQNRLSIAQLALNYCLQQELIDNVLIGVDSKNQLMQNLEAIKPVINTDIIREIDRIKIKDVNLLNPSLWT